MRCRNDVLVADKRSSTTKGLVVDQPRQPWIGVVTRWTTTHHSASFVALATACQMKHK